MRNEFRMVLLMFCVTLHMEVFEIDMGQKNCDTCFLYCTSFSANLKANCEKSKKHYTNLYYSIQFSFDANIKTKYPVCGKFPPFSLFFFCQKHIFRTKRKPKKNVPAQRMGVAKIKAICYTISWNCLWSIAFFCRYPPFCKK